MPKVLLIQTTQYSFGTRTLCKQKKIYLPGLALPLLAAYAPSHWSVKILIEVVDEINYDEDCDLVGIGAMGHAIFRAVEIADEFRKRGKKVFMGGYMVSMTPWFVRDHCDSIIIGDAELSYPELLSDFEASGSIKTIYDRQLDNLEGLLLPRYELLLEKPIGYMLPVQAGRGCPHSCSFCSVACLYKGRYLVRPPEEVMRDIRHIRSLGFRRFYLIDDNIVSNPEYLMQLASQIRPLKMIWASQCSIQIARNDRLLREVRRSGCRILSLGIESLSQVGLDKLGKSWVRVNETETLLRKIQAAGILPATEMLVGTDGDTAESIRQTAVFIRKNHIPVPKFYVLTPLPGTAFYTRIKSEGRLLHEDYSKYTSSNCVHKPANFTPEGLDEAYRDLYRKTYTIGSILRRTILNPHFFRAPSVYLFTLYANMVYRKYIRNGDAPNIL
ncbi:MAG: B12-binding domain-containing radical SAM protein [Bacteroidales bacterium]|nr:B12-binding domain-containing radical SAM protein [Bacteroidales bacterium]